MSEAEITQLLQANLAQYRIKVVVRQRQDHLHILLTRPPGPSPNYDGLSGQVRNRLLGLSLDSISEVTLYGREAGSQREEKYEWQQTYAFNPDEQESLNETASWDEPQIQSYFAGTDRDGPTIVSPKASEVDLPDDDMDDYPEDDAPTELYGTVSSSPFRTPEPEEGSYSTQTRQEQIPTGQTKEKKRSPNNKAVIGILGALAGVAIVVVVVLLAGR